MICIRVACVLLVLSQGALADEAKSEQVFRAGAATTNITPPLGEPIVGNFSRPLATNIHDELHARCIALDDGTNKLVLVVCDSLYIQNEVADEARALIAEETELPLANILVAGTHTHSSVESQNPNYRPFLVRRIGDAAKLALRRREPAQIGWGGVDEPSQLFNRRWHVTDKELLRNPFGGYDQVRMNPPSKNPALLRPAGPTDPEVSFVSVRAVDGRPIALLANYSLHYVGGVPSGDISADYFAIFSNRIGELLDPEKNSPGFVGMMSNGTSGDVNNINFPDGRGAKKPYEQMEFVANLVAQRVAEAHGSIEFQDWVPLAGAAKTLTLKYRKPDPEMLAYFEQIMAKPETAPKFHGNERAYAQRVKALHEGPETVDVTLQALKIGDLSIAAIPFETFTEIGLELKEETPFADAFTIELANGANGYLPTPAQHELGGYETWLGTNRVQFDASVLITKALFELMQELKSGGE